MSIILLDKAAGGTRTTAAKTIQRHDPDEPNARIADTTATIRRLREKIEDYRRGQRAGRQRRFVPTGFPKLDALLPYGGIPCGATTEILAEAAGVGSMSLAMRIAARSIGGYAIEPTTEPQAELVPTPTEPQAELVPTPSGACAKAPVFEGQSNIACTSASRQLSTHRNAERATDRYDDDATVRHTGASPATDVSRRLKPAARGSWEDHRSIVIVDTTGEFYPPAAAQHGLPLDRIVVLRTRHRKDAFWAVDQSLRCPAVAVVIAPLPQLDERESRRLQLAAESTGSIGLILRSSRRSTKSFAAIRMLLENPTPTEPQAELVPAQSGACAKPPTPRTPQPPTNDRHLCRITLLTVREGIAGQSIEVDLHHETDNGPLHAVPIDGPIA